MFRTNKKDRFIAKIYARLLPVQIILVAIQSINGIVDGIIGSRLLGSDAMAAVGLFSPLLTLLYALVCIIIVGSQVVGSHYTGKGEINETNKIFSITLCLIAITGTLAAFLISIFNAPLAAFLKGNKLLSDYMLGVAFSFMFDSLCAVLADYLQLIGDVKRTYLGLISLIVSNVLFNIVFIRILGFGIFGLGLATTLSTIITCSIMASAFFHSKSAIHFTLKQLPWNKLGNILCFGSSSATYNIVLALKGFALNYIVLFVGGELALGAMAVENSILGLTGAISMGIGTTTLTTGSVFYGEEDREAVKSVFRVSLKIGITLAFIVTIGIIGFSGPLSFLFYGKEATARIILQDILILSTLYIPFNVIICVFTKMYHIQGKMVITNILSCLENGLVIIAAFVLGLSFGLKGIWLSLPVSSLILFLGIIGYVWIKNQKVSLKEEDMILLSDTFGADSDNSIYMNIYDNADINEICSQIKSFIISHASNIRGLNNDNFVAYITELIEAEYKQCNMSNISIMYKDNNIIVRIRSKDKDFRWPGISSEYKTETQTHLGISEVRVSAF